ncbi:MAG: hypothetical protein ACI93R_003118 [Flavobacteriales bacterium]|jgi:hypothetical protein
MSRAENKIAENLITDNIDIWTGAIKKRGSQGRGSNKKIELYGIKKLRELILDLAVRGLLVPQDSNDEPVSVLLEKIAAERDSLLKNKKIKTNHEGHALTKPMINGVDSVYVTNHEANHEGHAVRQAKLAKRLEV